MNYDKDIFFKSNPSPMWVFKLDTLQIINVNNAAMNLYGYERDEFLTLRIPDLLFQNEVPKFNEHFSKISFGLDNAGLWRHKKKNGEIIIVDIVTETFEENGEYYIINAMNTVTNKISAKEIHELSINQFKYHLKNAPFLYIEWDQNIRIKNFSNEFLENYGFSYNDFYNKTPNELINLTVSQEDVDQVNFRISEIKPTNQTRTKFNLKFYDKYKNIVYSEWHNSILRDENNNVISILSLIEDVTKRKKIEIDLKSNNDLIEAVIKSLPGIFYMFDVEGNYIRWNKNFEKLLGRTSEEFARGHLLDHYIGEDKKLIKQKLKEVIKKGEVEFTAKMQAADGTQPIYLLTGVRCTFHGKKYIVGSGFDITKLKQTERELKKANHTKEILLSEIHHRVKNNMAIISGLMELAMFNTQSAEAKQTLVESMLRIQSMAIIHEKLYQSSELSRIPMRNYISDLANKICDSMAVDIVLDINTDIDELSLDINRAIPVALILNELISNSLKHAFPGKRRGKINIAFKAQKENYFVMVSDNGVGINMDIMNAKTLGLTIIKTLSKQLKANLNIQNDQGTQTTLSFPIKDMYTISAYT